MKKYSVTSPVLLVLIVVLQTTVLRKAAFRDVKPDLVLIILVIFSNYFGKTRGELLGAASGLAQDILSLSPLGFNTFVNTLTGYLAGITKGKLFLDPVITPVILVAFFTLLKEAVVFMLFLLFMPENTGQVFTGAFLIKELINVLLTPFVFYILKVSKLIPEYESLGF